MLRCTAACSMVWTFTECEDAQAAVPMLSCGAALALGPGEAMLHHIADRASAHLPPETAASVLLMLATAMMGMIKWASKHGATDALAQQLPPEQLLAFLRAAVDSAIVLHGPLMRRGAW